MVGWTEWIVIGSLIFIAFNARKIPDLMVSIARSFKVLKKELKEGEKKAVRDLNDPIES